MFAWDPEQYSRFDRLRMRPALDLLAQVKHRDPRLIYDLGTGRGQIARLMAERWPQARVVGTDTSVEMLREAAAVPSRVRWEERDVRNWDPQEPPDIVFSNAVLHWVPDHDELIVRIAKSLSAGGVLAVQMPLAWDQPSHRLIRKVLEAGSRGAPLGSADLRTELERRPVADPSHYVSLVESFCTDVDIWTTTFYQRLEGPDAVFEWVRGTALRPVLDRLGDGERAAFKDAYRAELGGAYPPNADGTTLYPFPRLFIVATRSPDS